MKKPYYSVWWDGDFIYLVNRNGGIHCYPADGSGNLTYIDGVNKAEKQIKKVIAEECRTIPEGRRKITETLLK